jgi:hypothetical protein
MVGRSLSAAGIVRLGCAGVNGDRHPRGRRLLYFESDDAGRLR